MDETRSKSLRRALRLLMAPALVAGLVTTSPVAQAAIPDAPTLTSPGDGAVTNSNPQLQWEPVGGATKYKVQISTSNAFGSTVVSEETYNATFTPAAELPLGTLHWRVAAMNGSGTGAWSTASFVKNASDAPVPTTPADGASLVFPSDPPIFAWEPQQGVQSYKLEIDDAPDFINATPYTTNNTSFVLTEPQTVGQTFYWRVHGVLSTSGVNTNWSPVRSYSVTWPGQPALVAPADGVATSIEDVVFEWQPVLGASTYRIQVSPNGDWANNIVLNEVVKSTRFSPPKTLNNDEYYWRVQAQDAKTSPNLGPWSEERQFERAWLDEPQLLYPANGNNNLSNLEFSWTPVDHASFYELQMSTDSNFSPGTTKSCYTNHTTWSSYELSAGYTAPAPGACTIRDSSWPSTGTQTFWRVRGIDSHASISTTSPTSVMGLWSDPRSFMYQLAPPSYVGPLSGTTTHRPTLEWDKVPGAVSYKVTVINKNGSTVVNAVETLSTSYTPTAALTQADAPFKWYVRAYDAQGRGGLIANQLNWWTFTPQRPCTAVDCVNPWTEYASPDLLTPADGNESHTAPTMAWQPVEGADHYRVYYSVPGSPSEAELSTAKLHYPAYTHSTAINKGTYEWRVYAFSKVGDVISVSDHGTFTINEHDLVSPTSPANCDNSLCDWYGDTPTMRWDPVPGADLYRVYLSNDPNFTNIVREYTTENTSLTPRESLLDSQAGQAYYWFVRPCTIEGSCGRFNNDVFDTAWAFKKRSAPINLISPANDSSVPNLPTFEWQDFLVKNQNLSNPVTQEAKTYKIQISTVADFSSILHEKEVDQTTYTPYGVTLPEGPLYWRVFPIDASNNALTVSDTRLVKKESPALELSYPNDGGTLEGVPYLRWNAQNFAAKYDVEIYKQGDLKFTSANRLGTGYSGITKMAAWSPSKPLAAGTYAWRVRRLDADDRPGPWSEGRTFELQPDAPQLLSPAPDHLSQDHNVTFEWNGVLGATRYKFELAKDAAFTQITDSKSTVMTSWAPTKLIPDGSYYWRVSALDGGDNVGPASSDRVWVKDVNAPETSLSTPIPTGTIQKTTATANFTSSEANATFECSIDNDAWKDCVSPMKYTKLAQGKHTFEVRAVDAVGNKDGTPAKTEWIVSTLDISKIVYKAGTTNGEYVQIKNLTGTAVDMDGFKLLNKKKVTYVFNNFKLGGRASVKVKSGTGGDTATTLFWGRSNPVWNNTSDTATLKARDATESDVCTYNNAYINYTSCS